VDMNNTQNHFWIRTIVALHKQTDRQIDICSLAVSTIHQTLFLDNIQWLGMDG